MLTEPITKEKAREEGRLLAARLQRTFAERHRRQLRVGAQPAPPPFASVRK